MNALGALGAGLCPGSRRRCRRRDDQHALALGCDLDGGVDRVALAAVILLRQELHGEVNALQFAAGNFQVARLFGAAAEQDRVIVLGEGFDRPIDAHMRVVMNVTPSARICSMRRSMTCFSSLKLGMP